MPDLKQELKDELNTLTQTLRTEVETKLKNFAPTSEIKEFEAKIIKQQSEIIDKLAELQKPVMKVAPGDIPKPINPDYTKNFYRAIRGQEYDKKALVAEDSSSYGRLLLPEELENTIREGLPQLNVVRQLATVRTIARDRLRVRKVTVPTVAWGKLEGGTSVSTASLVASDQTIYAEDLNGLVQIGVDELMDTDLNLAAYIASAFGTAMANAEESAFAIGEGHAATPAIPSGIFSANAAVATKALAAANAVVMEDVRKLVYELPAQYRSGASWLMHSGTELLIQLLRAYAYDASHYAEFLWQPSHIAGRPNTLFGYPIYNCDSIAQVGDGTTQKVMAFGNFKIGYEIIDRMGMSLTQLNELYITSGLVGFLAVRRVGGGVVLKDAIRISIEP